jgi:carboxymethylenebutenolidase
MYMDAPGIREELRDMARRIGTVGYFVLLPNLYYRRGREGDYGFDLSRIRSDDGERKKMFDVMRTLTNAGVVADTRPILDVVRSQNQAAAGPVGCVGYCMSGQFVISVAAVYGDAFAAIASYYGVGIITDAEDSPHLMAGEITGEVYLAFASDDPYVPQSVPDALPEIMSAAGVKHRIEIYPDSEHGFAFPKRPAYNKAAAERHWERMFALFDRRLRV